MPHPFAAPLVHTLFSLRWPPAEPTSDTLTLVLVGRTGYYLDLRVFLSGPHAGSIDWLTAGLKSKVEGEDDKAIFEALLEYRSPDSRSVLPVEGDVGTFKLLPNGDQLESGRAVSPATGDEQEFEEVWRDLGPLAAPSELKVVILSRLDGKAWVGRIGTHEISLEQTKGGCWAGMWSGGEERAFVGGGKAKARIARAPPQGYRADQGSEVQLDGGQGRWLVRECS